MKEWKSLAVPRHCPYPQSALGAVSTSHTVWPRTHTQTCNWSSPRPHNIADADFNMLLFCCSLFLKTCFKYSIILIWCFFSHRQVNPTTIELGVNKRVCTVSMHQTSERWKIPQQENCLSKQRATREQRAHELPHECCAPMRRAKSQCVSAKGCMIEWLSVT